MQLLDYKQVQSELGIRFKKRSYLKRALTHSSYLQVQRRGFDRSNETLEFLGDAVLELVTREYLLHKYPDADEGHLSELKKMYTNTQILFRTGKRLRLGKYMFMNRGEESTGGRSRQSTIAACVEAIIGALYLDRGITYTAKFIQRILLDKKMIRQKDHKSLLNRWSMRHRVTVSYRVVKEEGPPHRKTFHVDLYADGEKVSHGEGETKKVAEQKAAQSFLRAATKKKIR